MMRKIFCECLVFRDRREMFWNYLGVDFGDFIKNVEDYPMCAVYVHIVRNKLRRNSLLNVCRDDFNAVKFGNNAKPQHRLHK